MKRFKRLAEALGRHDDYSYDRQYYGRGGKVSRKNQRVVKKILTRRQRRRDNKLDGLTDG